jgi:hypothetical protein
VRKLVTRHRPDLVEGVEVVDGPLPVGEERVLVHLDVRGSPAASVKLSVATCQAAVMVMNGAEHSLAPPQLLRRGLVLDHALVPGRASGLGAGQRRQRASGRDEGALLVLDRLLVQLCLLCVFHSQGRGSVSFLCIADV